MRARITLAVGSLALAAALGAGPSLAQTHDHGAPPLSSSDAPAWSQADQYYDPKEMAAARAHALHEMGGMTQTFLMADRLEVQVSDTDESLVWDAQGWYGGDIDKLWFKSEGEVALDGGGVQDAEVQVLWSRAVSAYWDVQAGLRYDIEPEGRAHAVLGVHGLAPYLFEIDAAAFLSEEGDLTAHIETEYDLRFTQRLILQPRLELEASAQDVPERGLGAGLTGVSAGLRLRYEIVREVAPYLGVEWRRSLGDTADYVRAGGVDPEETLWVAGVRLWY